MPEEITGSPPWTWQRKVVVLIVWMILLVSLTLLGTALGPEFIGRTYRQFYSVERAPMLQIYQAIPLGVLILWWVGALAAWTIHRSTFVTWWLISLSFLALLLSPLLMAIFSLGGW